MQAAPLLPGGPSLWMATSEQVQYPPLTQSLTVDSVVVGGGVTGLTTAYKLARNGVRVAVIEARRIGGGTTGYSTGNLYAPVSASLSKIARVWGDRVMHQVVQARRHAIEFIDATVREHQIDCGFTRCPWVLFSPSPGEQKDPLLGEYQAALDAGLPATLIGAAPLPFATGQALRIDDQAQLNPSRYAQGLAAAIQAHGGRIFEQSPVRSIDSATGVIETASASVRAGSIVVATHTPKGLSLLHTELGPYREYAIALRLQGENYPQGIFWQLGEKRTLRSYSDGHHRYLVVVGEKHKTGQEPGARRRYARLEQYARQRFPVAEVTHRWSAQSYRPADLLPYIGRASHKGSLYYATGFSTDGLVFGTVAGLLIGNQICDESDPLAELFDPKRFTPLKSAANFGKENANAAAHFLKDRLLDGSVEKPEQIPPGEGRLLQRDGERLAVYRDEHGNSHALSAVCPHMRCLVHWNNAEKTWDCPCHGSRFTRDGAVIEGPALEPLSPRRLD